MKSNFKSLPILIGWLVCTAIFIGGAQLVRHDELVTRAQAQEIADTAAVFITATPEPEPIIQDLIKQVFGLHATVACAVLECENKKLDPKAVNTTGNTRAVSRGAEYSQGSAGVTIRSDFFEPIVHGWLTRPS